MFRKRVEAGALARDFVGASAASAAVAVAQSSSNVRCKLNEIDPKTLRG